MLSLHFSVNILPELHSLIAVSPQFFFVWFSVEILQSLVTVYFSHLAAVRYFKNKFYHFRVLSSGYARFGEQYRYNALTLVAMLAQTFIKNEYNR